MSEVTLLLIYGQHGKYQVPRRVKAFCDPEKVPLYDGMSIKEVNNGNYFFEKYPSGEPVKNEKGNRGVSFSRFLTGKRASKPTNGDPMDLRMENWREE